MPTASVGRLEKQASMDACEPLRQGITMIEHKIRNLEKRKGRLDSCLDLKKNGKDLNSDQLEAISKYDAVIQHLEFARELQKQLTTLANDTTKSLKKQARKEAAEKAQQELNRTKELLLIQEVLANMGTDSIRDDFLQGKGKVKLTQEELQSIDDLYIELTPKKEEPMAFIDMFQTPAEVMMALLDGKNKEAFGTTYAALKLKLLDVANSGYFDTTPPPDPIVEEPIPDIVEIVPETTVPEMIPVEQLEEMNLRQLNSENQQPPIQSCTFQPTGAPIPSQQEQFTYAQQVQPDMPTAQSIETTYFTPSHLKVFKSGTIDFMQENEIDTPESGEQPSSIPTMTYTNQNYGAPVVDHQQQPVDIQPYQNQTDEEKGWKTVTSNSIETTVIEPSNAIPNANTNAWGNPGSIMEPNQKRQRQNSGGAGGEDWASQTEHWQQSQQNSNDGFITAGSNRGRGGRGRGGGGDRSNKGFQKGGGRGGSNQGRGFRGEGGYRGDRDGGYRDRGEGYNRESSGYRNDGNFYNKDQNSGGYQNGYQSGGRGGGNRNNRNSQNSDRPGGRGGGNNRGRGGGYRGGNQSGNFRQQVQ